MPVSLVRIDDRLIHGQVVLGWARVLKADRIVVANDRVAANEWERRLYAASVPPHLAVSFSAVEPLDSAASEGQSVILLFESVADLHNAVRGRAPGSRKSTSGGLHYQEGASEILPFVYLSDDDRAALKRPRRTRSSSSSPGTSPATRPSISILFSFTAGRRPSGGI